MMRINATITTAINITERKPNQNSFILNNIYTQLQKNVQYLHNFSLKGISNYVYNKLNEAQLFLIT